MFEIGDNVGDFVGFDVVAVVGVAVGSLVDGLRTSTSISSWKTFYKIPRTDLEAPSILHADVAEWRSANVSKIFHCHHSNKCLCYLSKLYNVLDILFDKYGKVELKSSSHIPCG